MMDFCCEKMGQAVQSELVIFYQPSNTFMIRGPCSMADDGDGHFDDMTPEIEISHCPFCGKRFDNG